MATNRGEFSAITLEDGSCAVLRRDPSKPRFLEVIATFYAAERARDYAQAANTQSQRPEEGDLPREEKAAKEHAADLSERQQAVLSALRANMDKNNLAEVRTAPLAKAAHIPLGSLHTSLEKKQLIRTDRPGSAKAPAVYQILDAPER